MKTPTLAPRWLSIEATAAYASISRATVYRLIDGGRIASSRVGTRRLVDLRSVDAYLESQRTNGPPALVTVPPAAPAGTT